MGTAWHGQKPRHHSQLRHGPWVGALQGLSLCLSNSSTLPLPPRLTEYTISTSAAAHVFVGSRSLVMIHHSYYPIYVSARVPCKIFSGAVQALRIVRLCLLARHVSPQDTRKIDTRKQGTNQCRGTLSRMPPTHLFIFGMQGKQSISPMLQRTLIAMHKPSYPWGITNAQTPSPSRVFGVPCALDSVPQS